MIVSSISLMTDSKYLGTIQIYRNLNEHHYYLTSTKSVICQKNVNCSPFQVINILPFHIKVEPLKLIYYNLISGFSKYYFKTDTICLLSLSSTRCTALEFDSHYFGILL